MGLSDDNRLLLIEAWDGHDLRGLVGNMDRFFVQNYVRHASDGRHTLEEFRRMLTALSHSFPDFTTTIEETVAEGDRIAYRWISTGTHLGPYLGIPPTGRRVQITGITMSRMHGGRIAEDWGAWDIDSQLRSLGIIRLA